MENKEFTDISLKVIFSFFNANFLNMLKSNYDN